MEHLEVSGAVRPLKWSLGVKWLTAQEFYCVFYLYVWRPFGAPLISLFHFPLTT